MSSIRIPLIYTEQNIINSTYLKRPVVVDIYFPEKHQLADQPDILLINDGQDLIRMDFAEILDKMYASGEIASLICVGIQCGPERKREYGVADIPDYKERGDKANLYTRFILHELLPIIAHKFPKASKDKLAFAGFSLGALSALDIVWNHPDIFNRAGVFSGSLWWRSVDQELPNYDDNKHRIMHHQIKEGKYKQGLQFFFECGNMDETRDRNNNGIIDSIDDTLDLINELTAKGYTEADIKYFEIPDGRHDVPTWARAFPAFLKWGWNKK
ncbi:MAG: esterase [Bacteroidetes bacterium]|nr:esterase [Bacteroidota bacterium]